MRVKVVICLLISSLLAGCMSSADREQKLIKSKQELIENPGSLCRFIVNKYYRDVYRIAKAGMIDAGMLTEDIVAKIHEDIEQAEITVQVDTSTLLHTEIKALSPTTSEYTEYYFYKWKYKRNYESHCAELKQFIEEYED